MSNAFVEANVTVNGDDAVTSVAIGEEAGAVATMTCTWEEIVRLADRFIEDDDRIRAESEAEVTPVANGAYGNTDIVWLGSLSPEEIRAAAASVTWEEIVRLGERFIEDDNRIRAECEARGDC
eukprot:tig00021535_g22212.t1